jgi:hypothetical protein
MIPKAVLLLAKLLEFHSILKNIMDRRERKEQKDKVKLTCHTAETVISLVMAKCQSSVLNRFYFA